MPRPFFKTLAINNLGDKNTKLSLDNFIENREIIATK